MKKFCGVLMFCIVLLFGVSAFASTIEVYVDAAPNKYGSSDYSPWENATFAAISSGSFVNMSNGTDPGNIGTTDFVIEDEVVYSFGDLGKRLTWIYWIENTSVADLTGKFEISLINYWGNDPAYDFYNDYYGSTWLEPTTWIDYNGGVIGTAGMAWWGAYGVNTQAALDADLAAWGSVKEDWVFTARLLDDNGDVEALTSVTSQRAPIPEPATFLLFGLGILGIAGVSRKKIA